MITAMPELCYTVVASPLGEIRLVAQGDALTGVYFATHRKAQMAPRRDDRHHVLTQAAQELSEYFAGGRKVFTTALALHGTEFQCAVWQALLSIPYGERRSYAQIASAAGNPQAVRAVGAANACNPLSIIVPCHRVVGADGSLTGYAGGMAAKRWLLEFEQAHSQKAGRPAMLDFGS